MSLIYIIISLVFVFIIFLTVSGYLERRRQELLVSELAPRLNTLIARIDQIPYDLINNEFGDARSSFLQSLATLKDKNDFVFNRCPKCQETLSVRITSYHGKILGCPNYPKCSYFIKVADIDSKDFNHLLVE
jgi:hypothetical protein